jgi:hypothetical protein
MNSFKEFQFASIIFIIAIPAQIFLAVMFITQAGTHPMSSGSFLIANGTFVIIYLLFYGMKTTIDDESIRISYGIGLIRKTIKLVNVKTVSVISSPWYYGWGIRLIPNGMMYNISGSAGVELTFKDTSRVIRIGSASAPVLENTINGKIRI